MDVPTIGTFIIFIYGSHGMVRKKTLKREGGNIWKFIIYAYLWTEMSRSIEERSLAKEIYPHETFIVTLNLLHGIFA